MKRHSLFTLLSILALVLSATVPLEVGAAENTTGQAPGAAGTWSGGISLPNGELALLVSLSQDAENGWSGTIDIPAQGLRGFDLSEVSVDGAKVHFEMAGIPGVPTFDGAIAESGDAIEGTFRQGGQTLPFSLQRSTEGSAEPSEAPAATITETDEGVPGDGAVGEWMGKLDVGGIVLRLALHVESDDADALVATLDSLDQGAHLPIAAIALKDSNFTFSIPGIGASYEGKMNEDGSAVEGTWTQGGQSLSLTFLRTKEAFVLNRPQEPQPPFPYDSEDLTFANESAGIELAGTLVVPEGEAPFPAVVFVTGSGAQDRDETLMGHRPFWVIADALARRGIASLRYDDRGAGLSGGDHMGSTVSEFATDVEAAVAFLSQQKGIDRDAIGIVGHSEGGLSGPMAAMTSKEIDFLVLLAPPGEALDALIQRQSKAAFKLNGIDEALIARLIAGQKDELELVKDPSISDEELRQRLRARVEENAGEFTPEELEQFGINEASIEQGIQVSSTPWFRSLIRQDPATYLKRLKLPVLALFGEKDFQVDSEVNAAIVKASLTEAGNNDFEVRILPDLNHLFQHAETGALSEYNTIEETFSPEALELIANWILERFGKP